MNADAPLFRVAASEPAEPSIPGALLRVPELAECLEVWLAERPWGTRAWARPWRCSANRTPRLGVIGAVQVLRLTGVAAQALWWLRRGNA